ncbi:MAG: AAA family ATPase [Kiritimatiellia bacterium]
MSQISEILESNRRALERGGHHPIRRALYDQILEATGRHFVGIRGPRGAGKTVMLQQLAASMEDACYISLDTLPRESDTFGLILELRDRYGFRNFFLDEVHFLPSAPGVLKRMYDELDVRVWFTSSVALHMRDSAHDLSRRVKMVSLSYFSYREYLRIRHGVTLPGLTLENLLEGKGSPVWMREADRFERYLLGEMLPYSLDEPDPLPLLASTVETVLRKDIPSILRLHVDELELLGRLLRFVGRSGVDGINYTSLSNNLGITKYKAEQYVGALEDAFLLQRLLPEGTNVRKEPKVLMMPPLRLLYREPEEARGGLREDLFVMAMRQQGFEPAYVKGTRGEKIPDFLLSYQGKRVVIEVGGKGKGRSQFKGITADEIRIAAEGGAWDREHIPLHLFACLGHSGIEGRGRA